MSKKFLSNGEALPESLDNNDINQLFIEYKNGSLAARSKIIEHNLRLVIRAINEYFANTGYESTDLFSIGCYGLIKAVNSFDVDRNVSFSTYALRCICNELSLYLRKRKNNIEFISLNTVVNCDEEGIINTLEDRLPSKDNVAEEYETIELYRAIRNYVDQLDDRSKQIVEMYFGFNDDITYKQTDISKMFNMSSANVSIIISECVKKIGEQLDKNNYIVLKKKK